jgi:4-hydroxybenzoate polyprenyltransferase
MTPGLRGRPSRGNALWQLARPRTCLVGMLSFGMAVLLVGTPWSWRVAIGALVSFLVPAVANLHNAYTDLDEDQRNLPGRVRLVETAGPRLLRAVVYGALAVIFILCVSLHLVAGILAVVGGLLLLSYSAPPIRAKARPVLGLVVFSLVVTVPFIAGMLVTDHWWTISDPLRSGAVWFAAYLFVWFAAKGMVKNIPDYQGDRLAGLRTSATIMPSLSSAAVAAFLATGAVYLLFPVVVLLSGAPPLLLLSSVWIPIAIGNAFRLTRSELPSVLNEVLKWDMLISVGFLATNMLAISIDPPVLLYVGLAVAILAVADLIGADSRASHLLEVEA